MKQCNSCRHSTAVLVCVRGGVETQTILDCGHRTGSKAELSQWRSMAKVGQCPQYEYEPGAAG